MTTTDPQPTVEPEQKPRKRKPKAEKEAELATSNVVDLSAAKPRRKRKTKAEQEAERLAEINKPIDPLVWHLLGGLLLVVALCIFFDPIGFATAGQPGGEGMWIRDVLVIIVGVLGKNPTAIILTALALLSLGWGVRGWLRKRSGADGEPKQVP